MARRLRPDSRSDATTSERSSRGRRNRCRGQVRVEGCCVCPLRGVTRVRQRRGCSGGSGLSCGCSRTPCRCRRTRSGVSGRSRSPRSASPRGTTGTPCAQAPPRDEPTGQRPPRCSPSSSRQRTDSDTGHGCPGAPVPGPGNPHRRRAPAAVRSYSRHASFMHADLRLYAFLASSGRFERFRGEKRGCCVRSRASSRSKNQSDGQVEPSHRCSAYLCRSATVKLPGTRRAGGCRVAGAGWLAWLVAVPCLPACLPACLPCRHLPAAHLPWWWWWVHRTVAECVLPLSCPVPGGRADTVAVCGGAVVSSPCACWARSVGRRGVWWWCCRRWRRCDSPKLSPDRTTAVLRSPPRSP